MFGPNALRIGLVLVLAVALILPGCDTLVTEVNTTTLVDSTLGQSCLSGCHSDNDNQITVPKGQWEASAHASPRLIEAHVNLNGEMFRTNDAECGVTCHTSEGYIDFALNGSSGTQSVTSPIGCYTCHMPHTGKYAEWTLDSLRGQSDLVFLNGGFGFNMGKSNMCANCHQAKNGPPSGASDLLLSGDWGPHFSPQAEVVSGVAGFRFGEEVLDTITHTGITGRDGCISCHYGYPSGIGMGYQFGEHTFRLEDSLGIQFHETCNNAACHGSSAAPTEITDFYDFASLRETDSLANLIRDSLLGRNLLDTTDPSGMTFYADSTLRAFNVPILYNYLLYQGDGSKGLHNPLLMHALMTATAARVDSLPPQASFVLANPGDTLICDTHGPVSFVNTSLANNPTYLWNIESTTGTNRDFNYVFIVPGTYDVSLVVKGPGELADTVIKNNFIVVEGTPTASFSAAKRAGCDSMIVTFADHSVYARSWTWDFGDGNSDTIANPTHHYAAPGSYTVSLTVDGICGSDNSVMTDYINIRNDTEVGDASFAISADTIDVGQSILFTNNSSTYDVWYWDFGDGTADSTSTPTSFSPSHLYGEFGEFEVKLTILYGCDTQVAFDTVTVLDTVSTTAMK